MSRLLSLALTIALAASASSIGVGLAAAKAPKTRSAAAAATLQTGRAKVNGRSDVVLVDLHGVTLYTLSGETAQHLKCVSRACFKAWPPYIVSAKAKLTKLQGVKGTLSKLHRVKAKFFQVMLNGHPLYRFVGDGGRRGSAAGEGINAFGGIWHVIKA